MIADSRVLRIGYLDAYVIMTYTKMDNRIRADFQGRVKFPIGGMAEAKPASRKADPVKCRGRRLQSGWKKVQAPHCVARLYASTGKGRRAASLRLCAPYPCSCSATGDLRLDGHKNRHNHR